MDHTVLYNIGLFLERQNKYKEAYKYFYDAAELGNSEASYLLGIWFESGVIEKNIYLSILYLLRASDSNHHQAQYKLGTIYENGIVFKDCFYMIEAVSWYKKAALNGNIDALYKLGKIYLYDATCIDLDKAVKLFIQAKNSLKAKYRLGFCYRYGIGVNKDVNKATQYENLHNYSYDDKKLNNDYNINLTVITNHAKLGDSHSQYLLGNYYFGNGIVKDYVSGSSYMRLAAINGHELAIQEMKNFINFME